MGATPLSPQELAAVAALVQAKRLDNVPADVRRAGAFMAKAADRLEQLPLLTSDPVKYDIAYDAAHDVGEALLAAHGYRTSNSPGQHEALGRYWRAILSGPPGDKAAQRFDQLRRARNQSHYEAAPIGEASANRAETVARELYAAAIVRGVGPSGPR
jgi:hypothetical protein